ncbi:MAG: hypothetical protein AAF138_09640 [Planctomycetota bacterium]
MALLVFVCAGLTGGARAQSVDKSDPPPIVTDPAWFAWYEALLERRLAECPRERRSAFYFSQSRGSDITGNGSFEAPYRTLRRATVVLDYPDIEQTMLLFERGDVWRFIEDPVTGSRDGLVVDREHITIADFGDPELPAPLFTAFHPYEPSDWIDVPGTGAYYVEDERPITWMRDSEDPDRVYARLSTIADVIARPGSFTLDTEFERLYVHPLPEPDGSMLDPRTGVRLIESVVETGSGIRVTADGCRVENMRLHGWGMNGGPLASQRHGLDLQVIDDERAVAVNVESYYGSSHNMVHAASGAGGGIATFVNCRAGLTTFNNSGETIFNAFSLQGGHQVIFDSCVATHGTLPSSNYDFENTRRGRSFYSHTGGGAARTALIIVHNGRALAGPHSCGDFAVLADNPTATELEDVRAFVVGERFDGGVGTGSGATLCVGNMARVNGAYMDLRPPANDPHLTTAPAGGWTINCLVELDLTNAVQARFGFWNGRSSQTFNARLWHCAIHVTTRPDLEFRMDYDTPHRSDDVVFRNSVLVHRGGGGVCRAFQGANPASQSSELFAADFLPDSLPSRAAVIPLEHAPALDGSLVTASPLWFAAWPMTPRIAYEINRPPEAWPIERPTIGPHQPPPTADVDLDGNGALDIEDLYLWSRSPTDANGNGEINDEDSAFLQRALRWGQP